MPHSEMNGTPRDQAIDWIVKLHSEHCTPADRQDFAAWLAKSDTHSEAFRLATEWWNSLDKFRGGRLPVLDAALRYRPPTRKRRKRQVAGAMAATLLLMLGIAAIFSSGRQEENSRYAAKRGGHETVHLADGSLLELNTDTEVIVHIDRRERSVELLRGEAFFKVVHDDQRPFAVKAGQGRIVDLGTQFGVHTMPERVVVAVQEGRVRVDAASGSRNLLAGQAASYAPGGGFLAVTADSVESVTAWRRDLLVFENRRLDDVVAELNRYYDTRLRLNDPELGKLRVSGTFHTGRLESTLRTMARSLPITLQRPHPGEIVLTRRGESGSSYP